MSDAHKGIVIKPAAKHVDIDLSGFKVERLSVRLNHGLFFGASLQGQMMVAAVDSGSGYLLGAARRAAKGDIIPVEGSQEVNVSAWNRMTNLERGKLIKAYMMTYMEHEIEEHLKLDGEYVFDPHNTGRTDNKPEPKHTFGFDSVHVQGAAADVVTKVFTDQTTRTKAASARYMKPHGGFPSREAVTGERKKYPR